MTTPNPLDIIKNEISLLETRLDKMRVQAKMAEMEVRERMQPEIRELERELHHARQRLETLASTSREAFEESRRGVESAIKELKKGFDNAMKKFTSGS